MTHELKIISFNPLILIVLFNELYRSRIYRQKQPRADCW